MDNKHLTWMTVGATYREVAQMFHRLFPFFPQCVKLAVEESCLLSAAEVSLLASLFATEHS